MASKLVSWRTSGLIPEFGCWNGGTAVTSLVSSNLKVRASDVVPKSPVVSSRKMIQALVTILPSRQWRLSKARYFRRPGNSRKSRPLCTIPIEQLAVLWRRIEKAFFAVR